LQSEYEVKQVIRGPDHFPCWRTQSTVLLHNPSVILLWDIWCSSTWKGTRIKASLKWTGLAPCI